MTIKNSLGKLHLVHPVEELMDICVNAGIDIIPIKKDHLTVLSSLPMIHRDPFDRLLISQAISENMTFVTLDQNILKYPGLNTLTQ